MLAVVTAVEWVVSTEEEAVFTVVVASTEAVAFMAVVVVVKRFGSTRTLYADPAV